MKTLRMIMLSAVIAVLAMPVYAQQGPPPGGQIDEEGEFAPDAGPGPGGQPSPERREEIRKKIEAVRIYRLTEELKLDSPTSAKVAALLGSLDQKRIDLMRENRESMMAMRSSLKSGGGDQRKLKASLDKLERNQREMADLREREWKGLKELLTVEQQARYILFQERFMRELKERIAGARGGGPGLRGGGRGGMGPGQGGGQGFPQE